MDVEAGRVRSKFVLEVSVVNVGFVNEVPSPKLKGGLVGVVTLSVPVPLGLPNKLENGFAGFSLSSAGLVSSLVFDALSGLDVRPNRSPAFDEADSAGLDRLPNSPPLAGWADVAGV